MMKKWMISLFVVGLLTGCMSSSPKYWQHRTIPSNQWSSDHNKCKRATDKYLGRYASYQADTDIGNRDAYADQMREYEVGKKQKKMVTDCMRKRGYVPIK